MNFNSPCISKPVIICFHRPLPGGPCVSYTPAPNLLIIIIITNPHSYCIYTVPRDHHIICPRSSDPFYIASYYIKWVITSWRHRVKRVCGVHFLRNLCKIFKNEDFGFKNSEKGQILMPFSGLVPSKMKNVS